MSSFQVFKDKIVPGGTPSAFFSTQHAKLFYPSKIITIGDKAKHKKIAEYNHPVLFKSRINVQCKGCNWKQINRSVIREI